MHSLKQNIGDATIRRNEGDFIENLREMCIELCIDPCSEQEGSEFGSSAPCGAGCRRRLEAVSLEGPILRPD